MVYLLKMVIFHGKLLNIQRVPLFTYMNGWFWTRANVVVPGLVMTNSLLLKIAIGIFDLPINSMVILHSYVNVYQRVNMHKSPYFPYISNI